MKGIPNSFNLKYVLLNLLAANVVLEKGVKVMLFTHFLKQQETLWYEVCI